MKALLANLGRFTDRAGVVTRVLLSIILLLLLLVLFIVLVIIEFISKIFEVEIFALLVTILSAITLDVCLAFISETNLNIARLRLRFKFFFIFFKSNIVLLVLPTIFRVA